MARRVPVSEVANLPFNLSEESISRGVASIRRQLAEVGLLPESQPTAASAGSAGQPLHQEANASSQPSSTSGDVPSDQ